MRTVSLSALRAAAFDRASFAAESEAPAFTRRPVVRRRYPRAIQWHIDRGLFSPCVY
jgi:hypothetical protein